MPPRRNSRSSQIWLVPGVVGVGLVAAVVVVAWPALGPGGPRPALPRLADALAAVAPPAAPRSADAGYDALVGTWTGTARDNKARADVAATLVARPDRTLTMDFRVAKQGAAVQLSQPFRVVDSRLERGELVLTLRIAAPDAFDLPAAEFRCRFERGGVETRLTPPNGVVVAIRYVRAE